MKAHVRLTICLMVLIFGAAFTGCAGKQKTVLETTGSMDQPIYLVSDGHKLLKKGNTDGAKALFERALSMNKNYVPAMVGLAQVESALGNFEKAMVLGEKALNKAGTKDDRLLARTALMRIHFTSKQGDWLEEMEDIWNDIREEADEPEEATLIMGQGYRAAGSHLKAAVCYRQVLDWGGPKVREADGLLQDLYKQLRAEPGTAVGPKMAAMDRVNRADLCVLLIQELKLPEYIEGQKMQKYTARFKTPQDYSNEKAGLDVPKDVTSHPFALDMSEVLKYELRGLELFPDDLFHPEEAVSRANFALVVEDILVRIKKEPLLKRAFVGNESPFPDVANDHYAFNAMVVCTTRNFLAANLDGAFRPDDPVTGAESLLALRKLKEEIRGRQVQY